MAVCLLLKTVLIQSQSSLHKTLTTWLTWIWNAKRLPRMLTEGNVLVLHKTGPTDDLSNYRGITILNSISKVLEYFMKQRLTPLAETLLNDAQGGFRPDRRSSTLC